MAQLQCIVVTPERTVRQGTADFVALTLYDGEVGIAPGRAAMIGRLGFGEMRITLGRQVDRYYVEGGFVEVLGDVVTVLTQRVVAAPELNQAEAFEQLETAQSRVAVSPEDVADRDRVVQQSRAQLRVARRATA